VSGETNAVVQLAVTASALTDLHSVTSGKKFFGHVWVTNTGATARTYRISIALLGAADTIAQYIAYDSDIPAYTGVSVGPVSLAEATVIRVRASHADVVFTLMGMEY
jgi:hypothetical protein